MKLWFTKGVWVRRNAEKKIENLSFTDIKSIAILRHAALGDMVLTRSFIIEARKLFPNAKITLSVISNYTRGIPEDLVDRVHIIHGTDQRNTPLRKRIKKIRELGYQDLIFDLACGNRSFFTCLLTPAILKFGYPYQRIRSWMFFDVTTCRSDLNFEVNDMLSMLNILGAKTSYPHVYNMPGETLKRNKPYIVYFIGASSPDKCWPLEYFSQLIQRLSKDYPEHDHLILEGLKEWENADEIMQNTENNKNISVVKADTIEETTSLLKGADMLVSNDTGIRHIAITCNTATIGLFIGGPYRYWPRYEIHDAVFPSIDEVTVSVDDVTTSCRNMLTRLSRINQK